MIVVDLVGDPVRGMLAESRFVERPFLPGGEHNMYELAFALAATGHAVELRGWLDHEAFTRLREAVRAAPTTGLSPRPPGREDIVVVPEGWADPLDYLRLLLSEARLAIFLLAPPGLFGWPFVRPGWARPDPLTVPLDSVAAPEHFRAMHGLGFSLLTHSPALVDAVRDSGVPCSFVGTGRPDATLLAPGVHRDTDVAGLMSNRWAPLVRQVFSELDDLRLDPIEQVPNAAVLARLRRSRILLWPSRIEGHATIPWEARSVGCVPVALSTNRFAVGLREQSGAVLVDDVTELAAAARSLLSDPNRWGRLSEQAVRTAADEVDWDVYIGRVAAWADSLAEPAVEAGARAGMGAALAASLSRRSLENQSSLEELHGEVQRLRNDRDGWVQRAGELQQELGRVLEDREQWHQRSAGLSARTDELSAKTDELTEQLQSLYRLRAVRVALRLDRARKRGGS